MRAQSLVMYDSLQPHGVRLAPLSFGFFQQEYWSGWPFPPQGDLLDPGTKPMSLPAPVLAGGFFATEPPGKPFQGSSMS